MSKIYVVDNFKWEDDLVHNIQFHKFVPDK